jgi:mannose-6-phosphate isomerase-like protein (cupin superfamily)
MYYKQADSTEVVDHPELHGGDGVIKRRAFFDGVSRLPVKFQVWGLDPGASEGSHTHEDDDLLEEVYYFLQGRGTMWADGEEVTVVAGDAVLMPPGVDHGFRNSGDAPLKLVILWGRPRE